MDDFFKYLAPGEEDKNWGLYINVAGKRHVPPHSVYPSKDHPSSYFFTWETGRVLDEYQIHYITQGSGVYENRRGKYNVKPGALMITKPGIWHRFRPNYNTGWTEHYVGFNGFISQFILNLSFFPTRKPVKYIGNREEILDSYYKIFEFIREEKPGFQQVAAGMIMKLLGDIVALEKRRNFSNQRVEKIIQNIRFEIRENIEQKIDLKKLAEENNIGYSYFRKMFKKYTGVPPLQYQLRLKIMRAKEMLLSSDKIIKEISYQLGFRSVYYFSRVFKNKTGFTPSEIRKTSQNMKVKKSAKKPFNA
ncbi:MAG TPA: AraC family transcriptional regulator [Bacteroidetes bacterium]|nr:AraC family transcriptional regulator [Bacteroidota bacterium]